MSNRTARLAFSLAYKDPDGTAVRVPNRKDQASDAPYGASAASEIDVPDLTAAATEYAVPFGSVNLAATLVLLENLTGQELEVKANAPPSASGTLSSGAVDITLANAVGDRLLVERTTSAGTAGVLSVKRKSDTEVTVQSWLAGTGIQALDTSVVKVYNHKADFTHRIPDKGFFMPVAGSEAPSAGKLTSVTVKTTATQSGAGTVNAYVFGDPE